MGKFFALRIADAKIVALAFCLAKCYVSSILDFPIFPSGLMWFNEVDFLLVFRKWLQEWLETLAIDFESPSTAE